MSRGLQNDGRFEDRCAEDGAPSEIERYRAWIAAKLLQGICLFVLLAITVVLFDSW
ncbi:hypothetical protein [Enterovirga aerilata]|uniref:Uncharacterized protein n=1 Tax=Enterovirga aerilata TaxID=2730920 RepID=A0A849ICX2_9HYPH|nr:hypothetical protein [Enterovirga sp. DB1703]NNM75111.1 hypothetical protein [Enterovirga sp. DB1703]